MKSNELDRSPPILPRKPNATEQLFNSRVFSSMRQPKKAIASEQLTLQQPQQAVKLNKIVMNARLELLNNSAQGMRSTNQQQYQYHHHHPQQSWNGALNDSRISLRKRSHNAPIPLIDKHNLDNSKYKSVMSPNRRDHAEAHKVSSIVKRQMPVAQLALKPDSAIKRVPSIAENHIR